MPDAEGRIRPISVPACPWHNEYRVGYEPVGASGPVHTKPLSYEFAVSEYRAMHRQRRWRDYYKRIWIESRPTPEPWTEVEISSTGELADTTARQPGHVSDLPMRPAGVKRGEH